MIEGYYSDVAAEFVGAIKTLAERPDNLDNLECYLSYNFPVWLSKYASTPEGLAHEMREFANMDIEEVLT